MVEKNLRNEKGSITLFVLLAIVFFLIVIVNMFITSTNKNRIQVSELDKIKEEYGKDIENIDQIYAEELEKAQKTVEDLKVGDRVYYDTGDTSVGDEGIIECIVLYDKAYNDENGTDYGVQMISRDVMYKGNNVDSVTLGTMGDFDASRESYNNALGILYEKAQEYLNSADKTETPVIATSARCVGSKPDDPDWDTEEMYISEEPYMAEYNNTLKVKDDYYSIDLNQMRAIENIDVDTASESYWLVSRDVFSNQEGTAFHVQTTGDYYELCIIASAGSFAIAEGLADTHGFRPVFTLKDGVKLTEGDGVNTPYTLAP